MLSGITITCFAASYLVALVLEFSRLFFRASVRILLIVGMSFAGLVAHTIYLTNRALSELQTSDLVLFSSWHDWCVLAAWIIACIYLGMLMRHPQNATGLFLLPLVLLLIALSMGLANVPPFERSQAQSAWRAIHAVALLIGTATVTLGLAAGLMYLAQSYRLKNKMPPRQGFRLPSLEWLQRLNTQCLWISTVSLAVGVLSGITLNLLSQTEHPVVGWTDPVVLSSLVLFLWLVSASLFEWLYKPARQGRKVAYLTLASFVFLALALTFVLSSQHGTNSSAPTADNAEIGRPGS